MKVVRLSVLRIGRLYPQEIFLVLISQYSIRCNIMLHSNIYPTRCNVTQFILSGNFFTCFGWYLHPSAGAQTTVSTASGICHTVMARVKVTDKVHVKIILKLQLLFIMYCVYIFIYTLFNSIHYSLTNNRCCRYSCLRSWWWVDVPPETCRAVYR